MSHPNVQSAFYSTIYSGISFLSVLHVILHKDKEYEFQYNSEQRSSVKIFQIIYVNRIQNAIGTGSYTLMNIAMAPAHARV